MNKTFAHSIEERRSSLVENGGRYRTDSRIFNRALNGWFRRMPPSKVSQQQQGNQQLDVTSHFSKESPVNIPGIDKIICSTSKWSRFLWICVVVVFYGLCIYQLVDRCSYYHAHPVGFAINMQTNTHVEFPSVTVCPPYGPFITKFIVIRKHPMNESNLDVKFANINTSLEEIWDESKIRLEDVIVLPLCLTKSGELCGGPYIAVRQLKTYGGTCVVMTMQEQLPYRGPQTTLEFSINRTTEQLTADILLRLPFAKLFANSIVFVPHESRAPPVHDVVRSGYQVTKGTKAELRFSIKEFHFLNTKTNPCMEYADEIECRKNCVEKELISEVECWLPFMEQNSSEPCATLQDSINALHKVNTIYLSNDGCNCSRACDVKVLSILADYHAADEPNQTVFSISYPDNSVEVITEYYSYTFNSLVSDVGGNLGFLVGICMFNFIEMVYYVVQRIVVRLFVKYTRT